jgi:hypothetical protein
MKNLYHTKDKVFSIVDVQHLELQFNKGQPNGAFLITKNTNYNFDKDMWDNPIYLYQDEVENFITVWETYKSLAL